MLYNVQFSYGGEEYNYTLDTNEMDRNLEDEDYAYWLIHPLFEINVNKDKHGKLLLTGYVKPYKSEQDFENDWFDFGELIDVEFTPA